MKKLFATLLTLGTLCGPLPALADPDVQYYTADAMGCMKLRECTDEVCMN